MFWGKKDKKEIDLEKIHYRYVNIYSDVSSRTGLRHHFAGLTRKEADEWAKIDISKHSTLKRIACVMFTYEIGDGLD